MLTRIEIQGPATFAAPAALEIDKKVNIIYGLNGTGKSTICRFLRDPTSADYLGCKTTPQLSAPLYVYNDDFVQENFYQPEGMKGIFSLSKENKEAEKKIQGLLAEQTNTHGQLQELSIRVANFRRRIEQVRRDAEDALWEVKTTYSGGDRVLEYCLEGLRGKKSALFDYVASQPLPTEPTVTIEQLKADAQAVSSDEALPLDSFQPVADKFTHIEKDTEVAEPVVAGTQTNVGAFFKKLNNVDWARDGLEYVSEPSDEATPCPFCTNKTITSELLNNIRALFDDEYDAALQRIKSRLASYRDAKELLPQPKTIETHLFATSKAVAAVGALHVLLQSNIALLEEKIRTPSRSIELSDSTDLLAEINQELAGINEKVEVHNQKIANKKGTLDDIKISFWEVVRWTYDQTIKRYKSDIANINAEIAKLIDEISKLEDKAKETEKLISQAQAETVNIEFAIESINQGLLNLGIDDFKIIKHSDTLYRLERTRNKNGGAFSTLSEGEKTVITLLYFCELCKGLREPGEVVSARIAVLDDPVSSLSHIYMFNVGQLIKEQFFNNSEIAQVFVLTHSLYFFYELTDTNHERRSKHQALFRISKSQGQSKIQPMRYEEIQNDYQAYWEVINDPEQHPALIANCMRNIIEYFFNFVAKQDYNNVFQNPALKANRFQAFARFMNRESHSLGQNLFDLKEFDYAVYREGLGYIFDALGYPEHYKKMSKI